MIASFMVMLCALSMSRSYSEIRSTVPRQVLLRLSSKKITTKLFIGAERAATVDEKNFSTSTDASDNVSK